MRFISPEGKRRLHDVPSAGKSARVHVDAGMECVNCHGSMENHALALLNAEEQNPAAKQLIKLITPVDYELEEINARQPNEQQPDCLTCHVEFAAPDSDSAFNEWTEDSSGLFRNRKDEMDAVMCAACHNAPHAISRQQ